MCQQCDFDKIKSRDIKIRNPLKITGFIEDTAFSYWAVKPIIYHRKVNGRDELFNYYEIYTRNNVRCVICPPQSLKRSWNQVAATMIIP